MTKSEKSSWVFLKISFTIRQRLTPERACSTLTRICESLRLVSFSLVVSSFLCGFFSVDRVSAPSAHSLETLYPCVRRSVLDKQCSPCLPPSYHAFCQDRSGSGTIFVSSWQSQSPHSCHYGFSSYHCSAKPVFQPFSGVAGVAPCHR